MRELRYRVSRARNSLAVVPSSCIRADLIARSSSARGDEVLVGAPPRTGDDLAPLREAPSADAPAAAAGSRNEQKGPPA